MTSCAVLGREISNFLFLIEWETWICTFDWSFSLSTANPRYAFDLHVFGAETLLILLH